MFSCFLYQQKSLLHTTQSRFLQPLAIPLKQIGIKPLFIHPKSKI